MKTRTNQPVVLDNGQPVDDSKLGGTKLYKHQLELKDDEQVSHNVTFISKKSSTLTMNDFINECDDMFITTNVVTTDAANHTIAVTQCYMNNDELYLAIFDLTGEQFGYMYIEEIVNDIVTEF